MPKKDTASVIQLEDLLKSQSACYVKCVVKVTRLIHKPRIKNDKWLVVTGVADETGELNVTFDDEVGGAVSHSSILRFWDSA